jgi:Flp pilus assembly protein TadD
MLRFRHASLALPAAMALLLASCSPDRDKQGRELTAESRLRVAEAAEESGDKSTALAMYTAAANDPHPDTQTQLRSAEGMARNGAMVEAEAMLHKQLRSKPDEPDLLRTLGAIQIMSGNSLGALSTLTKVLELKPGDIRAMTNKAVALDIQHRHAEAQQLYRRALAAEPGDVAISNDLALSLMLSGQRQEARELLAPFRNSNALSERVGTNLGIVEAVSGHEAEARALLGNRFATSDLASLTRAITMEQSASRPDPLPSPASRRVIVEPAPAVPGATGRQPLSATVRVQPAAGDASQTETVIMAPAVGRVEPMKTLPLQAPAPRERRPIQELGAVRPPPPVVPDPVRRESVSQPVPRAPLQEDLLPKRLRETPAVQATPQAPLRQEPLTPPAAPGPAARPAPAPPPGRRGRRPIRPADPGRPRGSRPASDPGPGRRCPADGQTGGAS